MPMVRHQVQINQQDCAILVLIWSISEREQHPAIPFCLHNYSSITRWCAAYAAVNTQTVI